MRFASWALRYLACPVCRGSLSYRALSADGEQGVLEHVEGACRERYPIIDGIPRLLGDQGARAHLYAVKRGWFDRYDVSARSFDLWKSEVGERDDLRLVRVFDSEWRAFPNVGRAEHAQIFERYFDLVPATALSDGRVVLDAGCGAGRWALEVLRHGARVIALDLGLSVEVAAQHVGGADGVACVQADVRSLPLADDCVDLAYSLGVLHHIRETSRGLGELARVVKPGGLCLFYLYYALDSRGVAYRALFRVVDAIRRVTSALPRPGVVLFSTFVAALVYFPLARVARLMQILGLTRIAHVLPLSYYASLTFETMRNDSLDRFGTALELRFTRARVVELAARAGLSDVRVSDQPPYWHALGRKA